MPQSRDSYQILYLNQESINFVMQRIADRLDKLEGVRGSSELVGDTVSIGSSTAGQTRLVGKSAFTSMPEGSLSAGQWELTVYDDGANPVFRIRYNDAGTIKVGDVVLT